MNRSGAPGIRASDVWDVALFYGYMPPAKIHQTDPTTSLLYEVLPETENVKLKWIVVFHNYTEARQINIVVTIDGEEIEGNVDVTDAEHWFWYRKKEAGGVDNWNAGLDEFMVDKYESLCGKTVKVEIETSEAIDGGKYLRCAVYYEKAQ